MLLRSLSMTDIQEKLVFWGIIFLILLSISLTLLAFLRQI